MTRARARAREGVHAAYTGVAQASTCAESVRRGEEGDEGKRERGGATRGAR